MLTLVSGDVGHGGEDIGRVRGGTLNAVTVVDSTLASFRVDVEPLQVIVEINVSCTEVSSEEGSVRGEDSSNINAPSLAKRQTNTGKPLMEVRNNGAIQLVGDVLDSSVSLPLVSLSCFHSLTSPKNHATMYPKTMASFVSSSPGGAGIPVVAHKSPFHSSK